MGASGIILLLVLVAGYAYLRGNTATQGLATRLKNAVFNGGRVAVDLALLAYDEIVAPGLKPTLWPSMIFGGVIAVLTLAFWSELPGVLAFCTLLVSAGVSLYAGFVHAGQEREVQILMTLAEARRKGVEAEWRILALDECETYGVDPATQPHPPMLMTDGAHGLVPDTRRTILFSRFITAGSFGMIFLGAVLFIDGQLLSSRAIAFVGMSFYLVGLFLLAIHATAVMLFAKYGIKIGEFTQDRLLELLSGLVPAFKDFLKKGGTNWFDEDKLPDMVRTVFSVLFRAEAAPMLCGVLFPGPLTGPLCVFVAGIVLVVDRGLFASLTDDELKKRLEKSANFWKYTIGSAAIVIALCVALSLVFPAFDAFLKGMGGELGNGAADGGAAATKVVRAARTGDWSFPTIDPAWAVGTAIGFGLAGAFFLSQKAKLDGILGWITGLAGALSIVGALVLCGLLGVNAFGKAVPSAAPAAVRPTAPARTAATSTATATPVPSIHTVGGSPAPVATTRAANRPVAPARQAPRPAAPVGNSDLADLNRLVPTD